MSFEVTNRSERGWTWVDVSGEVDLSTAKPLKEHFLALIDDGDHRIVADLSAVGFLDSSGLSVLVGALNQIRERSGTLAVVCPEGPVAKVFAVTGLDTVFQIYQLGTQVPDASD